MSVAVGVVIAELAGGCVDELIAADGGGAVEIAGGGVVSLAVAVEVLVAGFAGGLVHQGVAAAR